MEDLGYNACTIKLFEIYSAIRRFKYDLLERFSLILGLHLPDFLLIPMLFAGSLFKGLFWRIPDDSDGDSGDKFNVKKIYFCDDVSRYDGDRETRSCYHRVLWILRYSGSFDQNIISNINRQNKKYLVINHENGDTVINTISNTIKTPSNSDFEPIMFGMYMVFL